MTHSFHRKTLRLALLWIASLPALADTQFRVKTMTRDDVPLGKGQCDIRLRIDREVEVSVGGNMVFLRTITGRDGRDAGSECNISLPARRVSDFNWEVRDSRGEILLLSEPALRNGFRAVLRIRDNKGGEGRYHFRLSWRMEGGEFPPNPPNRGDGSGRGDWPTGGDSSVARAIDACSDAVSNRIYDQYRYYNVEIDNARADSRPGRNDYIIGTATGGSGFSREDFSFSCRVDFRSGRVRFVDVTRYVGAATSRRPRPTRPLPSKKAATEPAAAEPDVTEPVSPEQISAEPEAAEQVLAEPAATEPISPEPVSAEPAATEQVSMEPATAEPAVAEQAVTEQVLAEPAATEQISAEPVSTEPAAAEPALAEQAVTEQVLAEPAATEQISPEQISAEPEATEPVSTEPAATEPAVAEQAVTEQVSAEPAAMEQVSAEPVSAEPAAAEPVSTEQAPAEQDAPEQVSAEKDKDETEKGP